MLVKSVRVVPNVEKNFWNLSTFQDVFETVAMAPAGKKRLEAKCVNVDEVGRAVVGRVYLHNRDGALARQIDPLQINIERWRLSWLIVQGIYNLGHSTDGVNDDCERLLVS